MDNNIDCIIPAAGLSSRMGQWKLMLAYKNHTILDECIENALSFCSRVILVTGYNHQQLVQRYSANPAIKIVVNENYELGMFSSIQLGVAAVESEYFFICHGDMPCVKQDVYQQLWRMKGDYVLFPGDIYQKGHPVLLPQTVIPLITNMYINGSMKQVLNDCNHRYLLIKDNGIYFDVDTPEAYQQLLN